MNPINAMRTKRDSAAAGIVLSLLLLNAVAYDRPSYATAGTTPRAGAREAASSAQVTGTNAIGVADLTCNQWSIVSSPNPAGSGAGLLSVAASAADSVWAVGNPFLPGFAQQTLAEKWDGSSWSVASTPSPPPGTVFQGVAAIAADNVWAVGFNESDQYRTLIEHWDGANWAVVPSPNASTGMNLLWAVSAVSPNDIWAVGEYRTLGGAPLTLTEHWDGSSWSIIGSPNVANSINQLTGVAAISSNDVWAAGYFYNDFERSTLIEHWDGASWSIVPSPNTGIPNNVLSSIDAVAPDDLWAVGSFINTDAKNQTLIQHWDGSSWSIVPSPNMPSTNNVLYSVSAASANDVWAVGYTFPNQWEYDAQTLVVHWNGTSWSIVPSPNLGDSSRLRGVVSIPGTSEVWAVGDYTSGSVYSTLIEHYCRAPQVLTFDSAADTYVQGGSANRNIGAAQTMRVQASGDNRALVRFDQTAMQSAIGAGTVLQAKLRLTITDNNDNWGPTGRTVDVHRLLVAWAEGNGTEASRGTGGGATWNCAIDSDIADQGKDCSGVTEWEMGQPTNPAVHPWAQTPTATLTITNGLSGTVEFDVTADVVAFLAGTVANDGWLVRKTNESQSGMVSFGTKESSTPAQLVITYVPTP